MSDETPKALKIVVISMGIMLIGGFIWVAAVVASRVGDDVAKPQSVVNKVQDCKQVALPAPRNAKLNFHNDEWLVTSRHEVRRYSKCGELLQITTLTSDM